MLNVFKDKNNGNGMSHTSFQDARWTPYNVYFKLCAHWIIFNFKYAFINISAGFKLSEATHCVKSVRNWSFSGLPISLSS